MVFALHHGAIAGVVRQAAVGVNEVVRMLLRQPLAVVRQGGAAERQ